MGETRFLRYEDVRGKLTDIEMQLLRGEGSLNFELNDISYYPPCEGPVAQALRILDGHFRVNGEELPHNLTREWNHVPVEGRFTLEYKGASELEGYLGIRKLKEEDGERRFGESLRRPPKNLISGRDTRNRLKIKSISASADGISFYADSENSRDGWSIHCRRKVV